MVIVESENFIKQLIKLNKTYPHIYNDLNELKKEFPSLAYKELPPLNKSLVDVPLKRKGKIVNLIKVWRIRFGCSDINRGKAHGYRLFYCKSGDETTIFSAIFIKKEIIKEGRINLLAEEIVDTIQREGIL